MTAAVLCQGFELQASRALAQATPAPSAPAAPANGYQPIYPNYPRTAAPEGPKGLFKLPSVGKDAAPAAPPAEAGPERKGLSLPKLPFFKKPAAHSPAAAQEAAAPAAAQAPPPLPPRPPMPAVPPAPQFIPAAAVESAPSNGSPSESVRRAAAALGTPRLVHHQASPANIPPLPGTPVQMSATSGSFPTTPSAVSAPPVQPVAPVETFSAPVQPVQLSAAHMPSSRRASVAAAHEPPGQAAPAAEAQGVPAGLPAGLPAGAVVVYMPGGLSAEQFKIGPREVAPEVPDDFWPGQRRHPLGDSSAGMFRWPRALRGEAADDEPAPPRQTKSLLSVGEAKEEPAPATAAAQFAPSGQPEFALPTRNWRDVLTGTTSGQAVPTATKSKALFAVGRAAGPAATPAAQPTPAAPPARVAPRPATPAVASAAAPLPVPPGPTPAAPAVRPAAAVSAAPPAKQAVVLAEATVLEDDAKGNLKWRAKGSPARAASPPAPNGPQMASHVEPIEEPPAAPQFEPATTPANPAPPAQPMSRTVAPTPQAPQASLAPTPVSKALVSRSFLNGQPVQVSPDSLLADVVWTDRPQASAKALLPVSRPRETARGPAPRAPLTVPSTSGKPTKALLPNMFIDDAPSEVGLTTKPRSEQPAPTPATPVRVIVLREGGGAETVDSYYALPTPPVAPAARAHTAAETESSEGPAPPLAAGQARGRGTPLQQQRYQEALARMYAAQQRSADEPPPLVRPLRAISEMTKLPDFLTGRGDAQTNANAIRTPAFRESYPRYTRPGENGQQPATAAAQASRERRGGASSGQLAEQADEEESVEEVDIPAPPDISVDPPSSRRPKSPKRSARNEADKPDAVESRPSAVARTKRGAPPDDSEPTGDAAELAAHYEDAHDDTESDTAEPSAIEEREIAELEPGRTKAVRMRRSDGSSAIIYYKGKASQDAARGGATRRAAAPPAKGDAAVRRTSATETPASSGRTNPLRSADADE